MTDAPATNELLALADRISATPSYTGKDLRTWRTPILERCDGDGDGNAVSVILVDAKQREVLVKALRAAATPSAEVSVEELADFLDHLDVLRIAGSANDDEAELARALLDQFEIRRK